MDPNAPLSMGQASLLFDHIMRKSDERITPLLNQVNQLQNVIAAQGHLLAAQPSNDPLSAVKRKHASITNESLKKQYEPLEEMQIRVDAVNETLAKVAEENRPIPPEEALQLQKTLDEGKLITSRRLQFLEVAHVEGWDVAKCMEKNTFLMELDDDMQKQLKRARKDAKALEAEKKEKKGNAGNNGEVTSFEEVVVVSEVVSEVVLVVVSMACSGEAPGLAIPVDRLVTFLHIAPREVCRLLEQVARWPRL